MQKQAIAWGELTTYFIQWIIISRSRNSIYVQARRRWICIHRVAPKYVPVLLRFTHPRFFLPPENSRRFYFSIHSNGVVCRGGSFIGPHYLFINRHTWYQWWKENQTHAQKNAKHPYVCPAGVWETIYIYKYFKMQIPEFTSLKHSTEERCI